MGKPAAVHNRPKSQNVYFGHQIIRKLNKNQTQLQVTTIILIEKMEKIGGISVRLLLAKNLKNGRRKVGGIRVRLKLAKKIGDFTVWFSMQSKMELKWKIFAYCALP